MKNYIGNGKATQFPGVVSVTIDIEKARPFVFEYQGKKYLKFDVAPRREPDQYGKTHSVSVWTPDNLQSQQPSGQLHPDNPPDVSAFDDFDIPF